MERMTMGIDKSLDDEYPSVLINGSRYHFGRHPGPEYDYFLVENAHIAKDYWWFEKKEDFVAFLVNLPESADRNRLKKLYPDWSDVTHEQRGAYIEEDRAQLRNLMHEKQAAGTAQHFPVYPDDGSGPYRGHKPFRIENKAPLAQIERTISDLKRYQGFDRGLNDAGKLRVLEGFDWSGVSAKDKEAILQREVDFRSITKEQFEFVYEDIHFDTGRRVSDKLARKLFERASASDKDQKHEPGLVHFRDFTCETHWKTYPNGRPALYLVDANTRETVAIATADLPGAPLKPGEVFIKEHSENRGMLAALEQAGVVKATGETVRSGFVEVAVAKVLTPTHGRDRQDDRSNPMVNESGMENTSTNQMPGSRDAYRQMLAERAGTATLEKGKDKGIDR
jgi:hypothetical protein